MKEGIHKRFLKTKYLKKLLPKTTGLSKLTIGKVYVKRKYFKKASIGWGLFKKIFLKVFWMS